MATPAAASTQGIGGGSGLRQSKLEKRWELRYPGFELSPRSARANRKPGRPDSPVMRLGVPARLSRRGPALWLTAGVVVLAAAGVTTVAYSNRSRPAPTGTTVRVQRGAV